MNEKAFATRGARGIGHAVGNVATGAVRGFRRGVRFDPDAEDADVDGFVQEGSQHARRVSGAVRRAAAPQGVGRSEQGGMRSFMPPRPTLRMGATEAEVGDIFTASNDGSTGYSGKVVQVGFDVVHLVECHYFVARLRIKCQYLCTRHEK